MAVRVNKDAFNIRDKLSELAVKFGLKGSELMRAETVQDARDLVSAGRKNLIINGDMRVAQRGTSAVTANDGYPVDRWVFSNTDSADIQIEQSTDVPLGGGFNHSIKWSVNAASNTTGSQAIRQFIEVQDSKYQLGWGTSEGKSATLSFWIKGSQSGTVTASVREGANASASFLHLTEVSTSWTKHSFTIPHTSLGSWSSDASGRGVAVIFAFDRHNTAAGSTEDQWVSANHINLNSQTEWVAISGAEIYITGVQLEVGKNATDFEHCSYGEELALCQRYYQRLSLTDYTGFPLILRKSGGGDGEGAYRLSPPMRTTPSGGFFGTGIINGWKIYTPTNDTTANVTSITLAQQNISDYITDTGSADYVQFQLGGMSGSTGDVGILFFSGGTQDNQYYFSSEL